MISPGQRFLAYGASSNGAAVPRLPRDAGQVVFNVTQALSIAGRLESQSLAGGLGGLVDISSPSAIFITGGAASETAAAPSGALVLDADELSSFGAASLLIGGTRVTGADGAVVTAETGSITVDNAGDALTGEDIILASNQLLTVDQGAEIDSSGKSRKSDPLTLNGNGVLLRVSANATDTVSRSGVTVAAAQELTIDSGAKIKGTSVILDSSGGTSLDPKAAISGKSVGLHSGQIDLVLTNPGTVAPGNALNLSGQALQGLFGTASAVSLLSYSSIDIYGTGQIGALGKTGQPVLQNLTLSAGEIRGFNAGGGAVTFDAQNILVEGTPQAVDPGAIVSSAGTWRSMAIPSPPAPTRWQSINSRPSISTPLPTSFPMAPVRSP